MVKQIILDMNKELNKAIQNLGKAKASEKIAEKKYLDAEATSKNWESKAKMALQKGDQDLAKKALAKKVKADEQLASYKQMYESISDQTEAIGNQVEVLKAKRLNHVRQCSSRVRRWLRPRDSSLPLRAISTAQVHSPSSTAWRKKSCSRKLRLTLTPR